MSWCSDAPEDGAISLFAGLLAIPDMTLSLCLVDLDVTCFKFCLILLWTAWVHTTCLVVSVPFVTLEVSDH
jgi:hypothetical protein